MFWSVNESVFVKISMNNNNNNISVYKVIIARKNHYLSLFCGCCYPNLRYPTMGMSTHWRITIVPEICTQSMHVFGGAKNGNKSANEFYIFMVNKLYRWNAHLGNRRFNHRRALIMCNIHTPLKWTTFYYYLSLSILIYLFLCGGGLFISLSLFSFQFRLCLLNSPCCYIII